MIITAIDLSVPRKLVQRKVDDIALKMKLNNLDLKLIQFGIPLIVATISVVNVINIINNVAVPVIIIKNADMPLFSIPMKLI